MRTHQGSMRTHSGSMVSVYHEMVFYYHFPLCENGEEFNRLPKKKGVQKYSVGLKRY
jgi:hypothetical protein